MSTKTETLATDALAGVIVYAVIPPTEIGHAGAIVAPLHQ